MPSLFGPPLIEGPPEVLTHTSEGVPLTYQVTATSFTYSPSEVPQTLQMNAKAVPTTSWSVAMLGWWWGAWAEVPEPAGVLQAAIVKGELLPSDEIISLFHEAIVVAKRRQWLDKMWGDHYGPSFRIIYKANQKLED